MTVRNGSSLRTMIGHCTFLIVHVDVVRAHVQRFRTGSLSPRVCYVSTSFRHSLRVILYYCRRDHLLRSSVPIPSIHPLGGPGIVHGFIGRLPGDFAASRTVQLNTGRSFGLHGMAHLLGSLGKVGVDGVSRNSCVGLGGR